MNIDWSSIVKKITNNQSKKTLGQNFLINYNIIENLLNKISLGNNILEIGPGSGILSYGILEKLSPNSCLTLIEKDKKFIDHLEHLLRPVAEKKNINLKIIHGDGLLYIPDTPVEVISNIPYNISSLLFYHWLSYPHLFLSLTIMIQKEFGQKLYENYLINKKYSQLTVLIQASGSIKKIMDLSPQCFTPAPSVHSVVIHYKNNNISLDILKILKHLTYEAFQDPRKQLKNNIKNPIYQLYFSIEDYKLLRPEKISPIQYYNWALWIKNYENSINL